MNRVEVDVQTVARLFGITGFRSERQGVVIATIARSIVQKGSRAEELIDDDVRNAIHDEQNIFGRFILLGAGKAFDCELLRYVHISFVDERTLDSLKRLSVLEHKNIAAIYDSGVIEGKAYVARQFVEGQELKAKPESGGLEIVAAICDAVEYAHSHGICHGSICPSNIVVDERKNVYLIGFGSEVAGGNLPTIQDDVYSICALVKFLLPADAELSAIIRKGMQIDPKKRYNRVSELGKDIEAYRTGYPVSAFSSSPTYRIRKAIQRNRSFAALILIFSVVAVTVGVFMWKKISEGSEEERKRKAAADLESERNRQKELMVNAVLKDLGRAHEEAIDRRRAGEGFAALSAIPANVLASAIYKSAKELVDGDSQFHCSLGILHRLIGDETRAVEEQEKALSLDASNGRAHYEVGILRYSEYQRELTNVKEEIKRKNTIDSFFETGQFTPAPTTDTGIEKDNPRVRDFKERALAKFREATKLLSVNSAEYAAAIAIVTLIDEGSEKAKGLFEAAVKSGGTEDAVIFLSDIYQGAGEFEKTAALLSDAITADKGSTRFLAMRGRLYAEMRRAKPRTSTEPLIRSEFDKELADWNAALQLHPGNVDLLMGRAFAYSAIPEYQNAINDLDSVIEALKPDQGSSYSNALFGRATAYMSWGLTHFRVTIDAEQKYKHAIADFTEGIALIERYGFANIADAYFYRALGYMNVVKYRQKIGKDAEEECRRAIADFNIGIDSRKGGEMKNTAFAGALRAQAYLDLGDYERKAGRDPRESYALSIRDFDAAEEKSPRNMSFPLRRSLAHSGIGLFKVQKKEDPSEHFKAAVDDLDASAELAPTSYRVWIERGDAYSRWLTAAATGLAKKSDTTALYSSVLENFSRAYEIAQQSGNKSYCVSALTRRASAEYLMKDYEKAAGDFDRASSLGSVLPPALKQLWDDAKKRSAPNGDY